MKSNDTYKQIATYNYPNCIVRVYKPILTPEEYERRFKLLVKAAESLIREDIRVKQEKEKNAKKANEN